MRADNNGEGGILALLALILQKQRRDADSFRRKVIIALGLIGAALLIRTFIAIRQVNPGFDAHNVLTMRLSLTGPQFENPASVIDDPL